MYLIDVLFQPADLRITSHLLLASLLSLSVCNTWLSTAVNDQALLIAATRVWNILPDLMSHPHHLCQFSVGTWRPTSSGVHSFDFCSACEATLSLLDASVDHVTYLYLFVCVFMYL